MARLENIKPSISELERSEVTRIILSIRANRMKSGVKAIRKEAKTASKSVNKMIGKISQEQLKLLLEEFE